MIEEDSELLRRYADEKSESAFAEIVRRHIDLVHSAALRKVGGDLHLAQDVTQVVFTALARKAPTLARCRVLGGWLYRSTLFAASDAVRVVRRRRDREEKAQTMHEITRESPDVEVDWERLSPVLDEVMAGLGERDRDAVVLRFFAGLSFVEIGGKLQLSADAARMRVDRALDRMRTLLAQRGVTSTAGALAVVLTNHTVAAAPVGLAMVVSGSALNSAAGAANFAAGMVHLMNTTKVTLGIASALVILAVGTATHEAFASRVAEASLVVANREHDALLARLRDIDQRVRIAEQDRIALEKSAAVVLEPHVGAKVDGIHVAQDWDPEAEGDAFLVHHPEVKQALLDFYRAANAARFVPLWRAPGLSSAQVDTFQTLWLSVGVQFGRSLATTGETYTLRVPGNITTGEREEGLRTLLGEVGYGKLKEFEPTTTARRFTAEIAGALSFTVTPLTPGQSEDLIGIITENHMSGGGVVSTSVDWDAVLDQTGGILSPPQMAVLEGMRARDEYQEAINRAGRASAAGSPAP